MIDLRLSLQDHRTHPVPFGLPVLVLEPSISNTNVLMVFGIRPRVFYAWMPRHGEMVRANYDDFRHAGVHIQYTNSSGEETKYSVSEFLELPMLWCPRPIASKPVADILRYFGTLPDTDAVVDQNIFDEEDDD